MVRQTRHCLRPSQVFGSPMDCRLCGLLGYCYWTPPRGESVCLCGALGHIDSVINMWNIYYNNNLSSEFRKIIKYGNGMVQLWPKSTIDYLKTCIIIII